MIVIKNSFGSLIPLLQLAAIATVFLSQRCHAQRFMRQGFSNNEDFSAEMKLDPSDNDAAVGMTREMFLMQDIKWQLPPIQFLDDNENEILPKQPLPMDNALRQHIHKYLGSKNSISHRTPVELQLFKKRGKFGLRAVGKMSNGKRLRAFWRQSTSDRIMQSDQGDKKLSPDFLKMSYDDAIKSRLFTVEFEVQLPPMEIKLADKNLKKVLPSVVYQVPIESGSMNPTAIVPRGVGKVLVYPIGRTISKKDKPFLAGTCRVSVTNMKAGLVDPSWSKGKPIFRKGRLPGVML